MYKNWREKIQWRLLAKKQSTKDVQDISLTSNTEIEERGWGD